MHADFPKMPKKDTDYIATQFIEAKKIYESLHFPVQLAAIVQTDRPHANRPTPNQPGM